MASWSYHEQLRQQQQANAVAALGCGCITLLIKIAFFGLLTFALLRYVGWV